VPVDKLIGEKLDF